MRWIILAGILWYCAIPVAAQEDENGEEEVFPQGEHALTEEDEPVHAVVAPRDLTSTREYQQQKVVRKDFDESAWKGIVGDEKFQETEKKKDQEKKKADTGAESGDFSLPWGGPLLRAVSYAVVIGMVALLVYFIIRNITFDARIQRTPLSDEDPEAPLENIESADIQSLLDQSLRDKNYKLAVRLYYLRLLKRLNEQGIIKWKKEKTNREYLSELFSAGYYFDDIRSLTHAYETVWYGDHSLKMETFEVLTARFDSVYDKITKEQRP